MRWVRAYPVYSVATYLGWKVIMAIYSALFGKPCVLGIILGRLLLTNLAFSLGVLLTNYYLRRFNPFFKLKHTLYLTIPIFLRYVFTSIVLWKSPLFSQVFQFSPFVLFIRFIINSFWDKARCHYNTVLAAVVALPYACYSLLNGFEPAALYLCLEFGYCLIVEDAKYYHEEEIQPAKAILDIAYFLLQINRREWAPLMMRYVLELLTSPIISCLIDMHLIWLDADYEPVFEIPYDDAPEEMERKPDLGTLDDLLVQMDLYREQLGQMARGLFGK